MNATLPKNIIIGIVGALYIALIVALKMLKALKFQQFEPFCYLSQIMSFLKNYDFMHNFAYFHAIMQNIGKGI